MRRVLAVVVLLMSLLCGVAVAPEGAQAADPPERPTGVSIVEVGGNVAVRWDDQVDADGWRVAVRVAADDVVGWDRWIPVHFVARGTTRWVSSEPWTTAEAVVIAWNSAGMSPAVSAYTPRPSAPTGVTSSRTATTVRLTWAEASTAAVPVAIVRRARDHFAPSWSRRTITVPPGQRTWTEPTPTEDEVRYEIRRTSVVGHSAGTPVVITTPGEPQNVTMVTGCSNGSCTYTVNWSPLPGAASYRIWYRQLDSAGIWSPVNEQYVTGRRVVITAPRARTAVIIAGMAWDGRTAGPRVRLVARLQP